MATAAPLNLIRPRRRTVWSSDAARWTGRALVIVLVVAAWAIAAQISDLFPPLGTTLTQLVEAFSEGWIFAPMWDTMKAVVGGFLLAAVLGFGVGYALGRIRFLAMIFDPIVTALFVVPRIIFYPVLLALFGIGTTSKLWMGMLSGFFPIVLSTIAGIKAVDPVLVRLGRSLRCSRWQMATRIFLPAAAPTIMVGFRIGFGVSFISVIFAEFFAATQGLGYVTLNAYNQLQMPRMYAVVLVITGIAIIGNLILWSLERRIRSGTE